MRLFFILLISILFAPVVKCEERIAVAFYDVGRLYDTIPSNFYNDKSYTPKGRNRWGSARYLQKMESIVAVIDSMQMPIVALAGIEKEEVVRDIVRRSNQDYSYLHRTIDYYDGLDFALLYYGDMFYVERVNSTNYTLVVRGEIDGKIVTFHLARVGSRMRTIEPMDGDEKSDIDIAWGRLTRDDILRLGLKDQMREAEVAGHGDTKGDLSWYFKSRVGVGLAEGQRAESGVYITEWLLTSDRSAPLATFSSNRYYGGYSNHLPLFLYIYFDEQ
ncbi:MAG: hypothetical protein SNH55_05270 [Rikenellaceae bacterium]